MATSSPVRRTLSIARLSWQRRTRHCRAALLARRYHNADRPEPGAKTLLRNAPEIAGNLPAGGVFSIAHLIASERREQLRVDKTGFAGRRRDVKEQRRIGISRLVAVGQDTHQI